MRLDEEVRSIDESLRKSKYRDKFEIEQHWAVRVSDLQDLLLRHDPDIVHFSGHGGPYKEIVVEDDEGHSHPISIKSLSNLFSILKGTIKCVVLNACYSENQAREIANHIDCVIGMSHAIIGMSHAIGDRSAIKFSKAFYLGLGYGKDISTAFDLGRSEIDLSGLGQQYIPQLISKKDPRLIKFLELDAQEQVTGKKLLLKRCAYCGGTTRDPAKPLIMPAPCPVCNGKGENEVPPSAKPCQYCAQTGRDPASLLIVPKPCPICKGYGFR